MMRWLWIAAVLMWGAGAAALAPAQALYSDTFTGSDLKRPVNWQVHEAPALDEQSDEKYWFLTGGTFSTGNGDYTGLQTDGWTFATVAIQGANQWGDYSVRAEFRMSQRNGALGLVGRWQDSRNHYRGYVKSIDGGKTAAIERVQNNNVVVLATADAGVAMPDFAQSVSPLDRNVLALTFKGGQITLSMNGQTLATANDSTFSRGPAGLAEQWNLVYFDNFSVEPPSTTSAISTPSPLGPAVSGPATGSLYRIVVARGVSQADAQKIQLDLTDYGYTDIDVVQKGSLYDVLVGALASQQDAESSAAYLRDDGFPVIAVEQIVGTQATDLARRSAETFAPAATTALRVLIQEYPDQNTATQLKDSLETDGYFPVMAQVNGRYGVYVGNFTDTAEAQKLVNTLQDDGYVSAKVVDVSGDVSIASGFIPGPAIPTRPGASPFDIEIDPTLAGRLTPEQIAEAREVAERSLTGSQLADDIQDLRRRLKEMEDTQREAVIGIREGIEARAAKQATIARLFAEVDAARDASDFETAEAKLIEVASVDSADNNLQAQVDFKRRGINLFKERPTGQAAIQQSIIESQREQINQARTEAEAAEQRGDLQLAMTYWTQVLNLSRDQTYDKQKAREQLQAIREKLDAEARAAAKKDQLTMIILGVVGLVVVLLFFGLLFVWRSKRNLDKQLLEKVQELTVHPMIDPRTGQMAAGPHHDEPMAPQGMMELGSAPLGAEPSPPPAAPAPPARPAAAPKPAQAPPPMPPVAVEPPLPPSPPAQEMDVFAMPSFDEGEEQAKIQQKKKEEEEYVKAQSTPESEEVSLEGFSFEDTPLSSMPPSMDEPVMAETAGGDSDDALKMDLSGLDLGNLDFGLGDEPVPPAAEPLKPASTPSLNFESEKTEILATPEEPPAPPLPKPAPAAPPPAPQPAVVREVKPAPAPAPKPAAAPVPQFDPLEKTVAISQKDITAGLDVSTQRAPAELMANTVMVKAETPVTERDTVDTATGNVIYRQNFNDEEDGKPPRNWTGAYDYASLQVTSEHVSNGSTKCMKFEKKTGAGSAYYSCQFPNVSGKVSVEFDICCDNKNKYLLGFYVEKDKDFRKSIHTIIHRTATATHPTLRIQGEPIEYTLGEWRHIKYVLDLEKGFVEGFVDGQHVANHVKLENVPEYVNTLAIRDNLPTTGILRVDNIVIAKV